MATIINQAQPAPQKEDSDSQGGPILVVLLFAILLIFLYYFFNTLRSGFSIPSVQVPSKIDVNINKK